MKGHGSKFGRKQEEAVAALLTNRNMEEAARAAGIGVSTLLRWTKLPEFDESFREAKRAAFGQALARLNQSCSAAVATLLKIMVDPESPASARVRAAEVVLDRAMKGIELEDAIARIAALERAVEENSGNDGYR
jgi:hypothetical protein